MTWYLIKYKEKEWRVLKTFTQESAASLYREVVEKNNKSDYRYIVIPNCSLQGVNGLQKIVEYKLGIERKERAA